MIARYAIAYVATLVVFLAVDAVWLTIMATRLYKPTLGDILMPSFLVAPAALFYIVFIVGILIFATAPAFASGHWTTALLYGALFGFFSYGVYDFTNWSTPAQLERHDHHRRRHLGHGADRHRRDAGFPDHAGSDESVQAGIGARARATPIRLSRVTSPASAVSSQPSVPSGRRGSTI